MGSRVIIILIGILFVSTSCRKRLDSFLFNNDNSITQYYLDDFDGDLSLDLPNGYGIPESQIHQFKFTIDDEGETLDVSAIYIGDIATLSTDTVILYCHGNKDHMDHYWPRQKLLSYVGGQGRFGVLMFDYPGYGLSEGKPTENNMYAATGGALKWLKQNGLTNERLITYGYSLGSAPTCMSAGDKPFVLQPNKIILEAPFASSSVMVQDAALLNMPASFFVSTKISNAEQIKKCNVPLYWMHGIDDDFLSFSTHGKLVYDNHSSNWKKKSEVLGAGHNNVPTFMGLEKYKSEILSFILND
ncbi:MAG TPA: alpha/beta hydrolase [Brumimicrobium sp.]|nr:alpha/beta hydrolase [Brumimicrobium sp.]